MAAGVAWVQLSDGVPLEAAFGNTRGQGTPIIIDTQTDSAYYNKPGLGVTRMGGAGSGIQKYQCSCSDLVTELLVQTAAAYFYLGGPLSIYKVVATLLVASTSGFVEAEIYIDGVSYTKIQIPAGELSASIVGISQLFLEGARVTINVNIAGTNAKGLIIGLFGLETA